MNIEIAVPDRLDFLRGKEEFLVKFPIELIENQTPLGGYQSTVRVGVLLVPDVHDGLTLGVHFIQHLDKILFVVPVVPIALGDGGVHSLQRPLHDIVHLGDGHLLYAKLRHPFFHELADEALLFLRKRDENTVRGFVDRVHHLLHVEIFQRPVFLDNLNHPSLPFFLLFYVHMLAFCRFIRTTYCTLEQF